MGRREKLEAEELRETFEALTGRQGGQGIFGIEDEGDEVARQAKLRRMAKRIAEYDRGYESDGVEKEFGSSLFSGDGWLFLFQLLLHSLFQAKLFQQRLGLLQIFGAKPFGEPTVALG